MAKSNLTLGGSADYSRSGRSSSDVNFVKGGGVFIDARGSIPNLFPDDGYQEKTVEACNHS